MAEYIRCEDAYTTLTDYYHHSTEIQHMALKEALDRVPAADVRPVVKARWEKVMEQPYFRKHYHVVACSACRKRGNKGWRYCPNCGAQMIGGDEDV